MADAAIENVDLHIVRARGAAGDLHGFEGLGAGVGAVGVDGHGNSFRKRGETEEFDSETGE